MSSTAVRVAARIAGVGGLLAVLTVPGAPPAAAHTVSGDALPVPAWLLGYGGVALVLLTALALRISPRGPTRSDHAEVGTEVGTEVGSARGPLRWPALALYLVVLYACFAGPDTAAANVSSTAVLVVFWIGLPILCLLLGDVFSRTNPFDAGVEAVERAAPGLVARVRRPGTHPGPWTAAAFLGAFTWFLLAYHRPGSPRALGVLLTAYGLVAVGGGLRWGRSWLRTGEGFGALSAGIAWLRDPRRAAPAGVAALAAVWLGSVGFEALQVTGFWIDLLGTSRGWERTLLDTMGLVWVVAIAGGAALAAGRFVAQRGVRDRAPVPSAIGAALLTIAASWFVVHDLNLLLLDGQNFLALASDPIGRGWDLFGTIDRTVDVTIVEATWDLWIQLLVLLGGHAAAVLVAHRVALGERHRVRMVVTLTTSSAALAAVSVVVAALLLVD